MAASLPDRGELMETAPQAPVREGAYAWRPVRLSEAHALASLQTGEIKLRAPSGELLTLEYDRHEEHASGDWTWIGHVKGLPEALGQTLITFGPNAVFGEVRQADTSLPPLKLAMRNGSTWMGETSYDQLRRNPPKVPANDAIQAPAAFARSVRDGQVSNSNPTDLGADVGTLAGTAAAPPQGWTTAYPVVDVMFGYTAGYRDQIGSASAVVTRLNFLIDVMNAAFVTSKVPGRMRLVHAQYVTYHDKDIYVALEELAGINGRAVPASLKPLNGVLRDRYGADLVELMMGDFPNSNNACGLGYLPGTRGANPAINPSTDAALGFSAINRVCDGAVRHELGHNLGLNHDQITSAGSPSGPYPYSFGYKTTNPDGVGFHDVMAYGDPGQPVYNYYANPRIDIKGIPAGTGSTSDAARSLKNTLQYSAQYRATKVYDGNRVRNDINGDGKSDLMFHNYSAKVFSFWQMNSSTTQAAPPPKAAPANGKMVASGDFNGDRKTDLIWMTASRELWLWRSNGSGWDAYKLKTAGLTAATTVIGAADIDGDLKDEILLASTSSNTFTYWKLNFTTPVRGAIYHVSPGSRLVATGDFNADGKQDMIWMSSSRQLYMWWSNGGDLQHLNLAYATIGSRINAGWDVAGAADFNGDGKDDLLFGNATTDQAVYWTMNRNLVTAQSALIALGDGTSFGATGDFNSDGYADVVWRNGTKLYMWFSDGKVLPWQNRVLARPLPRDWVVRNGGVGG